MSEYEDIRNEAKNQTAKIVDEAAHAGYGIGYSDGYEKGLNDAWECAKWIALPTQDGGMDYDTLLDIFGINTWQKVFVSYSASEAIAKTKEYEKKKKADDEIKVGDEVVNIEKGTTHIITKVVKENYANFIDADGTVGYIDPKLYKKTGRHFDIQNMFEQMKGSNSDEN